jgi:hypothetical protein
MKQLIRCAPCFAFFWASVLATGTAAADTFETYPQQVNCRLGMEQSSSDKQNIESVAHSCNEFEVLSPTERSLVNGACILGGRLSGWLYSFTAGDCQKDKAAALCRVTIPQANLEEITYFYRPHSAFTTFDATSDLFRESCDTLGGNYEELL